MNTFENHKKLLTILHIAPITHNQVTGLTLSIPSLVKAIHLTGLQTGLLTTSPLGRYEKQELYPVVYWRDLYLSNPITSMPEPLNNPDLIVFHSTYHPIHAWLAYEAYRKRIPYIICPRGGMTIGAQQVKRWKKLAGNLLFFNKMVAYATALQCLTEQEATSVKGWNRPIFVVGNGVDLPPSNNIASPGKNDTLNFVFLGRLDINHKGLDLLLESCAIAKENLKKSKVLVHLYGSDVNGSKLAIEKLINNYKIQDLVYLHDPILGEAKQKLFQSVDLFLHTSRFEGHPMAVLEAMSYGIPCLLTPGTNMAETVAEVGAGWSVKLNASAIAQCLCDVVAARLDLPVKGQAARNLAEKYSWNQIASQIIKEYQRILN